MEFKVGKVTTPPTPQETLEKIQELLFHHMMERRASDPRNLVFEYTDAIPVGQLAFMHRREFADGRHRVFLRPEMRDTVEAAIAALPNPTLAQIVAQA